MFHRSQVVDRRLTARRVGEDLRGRGCNYGRNESILSQHEKPVDRRLFLMIPGWESPMLVLDQELPLFGILRISPSSKLVIQCIIPRT